MDQIRLCDIGRWNIGPTVRSVDSVLENSSEVGEKADYPVYQPCKKEPDYGVHECIESLAFAPLLYLSSLSLHDSNSTSSTLPFVASIAVTPTFARTIKNMLPPTGHYRLCSAPRHRISYLGMHTVLSRPPKWSKHWHFVHYGPAIHTYNTEFFPKRLYDASTGYLCLCNAQ